MTNRDSVITSSNHPYSNAYGRSVNFVDPTPTIPAWTFLTNHAHVLIAISRNPELRQRDISFLVGITPGAVQRIIADLETEGYIRTERVGRRNRYEVIGTGALRHPLENDHCVEDLLKSLD